jgi:hypothetical protein
MYKNTDVLSLGTEYTVADRSGKILKTIQIMTQADILDAALGPYTEEFGSFDEYLEKSIKVLSNFEQVNHNKVLWYASMTEEVILAEVIEFAIKNNYDRIILEYIEDQDE